MRFRKDLGLCPAHFGYIGSNRDEKRVESVAIVHRASISFTCFAIPQMTQHSSALWLEQTMLLWFLYSALHRVLYQCSWMNLRQCVTIAYRTSLDLLMMLISTRTVMMHLHRTDRFKEMLNCCTINNMYWPSSAKLAGYWTSADLQIILLLSYVQHFWTPRSVTIARYSLQAEVGPNGGRSLNNPECLFCRQLNDLDLTVLGKIWLLPLVINYRHFSGSR